MKTEEVFGVSNKRILSYIERPLIDEAFREAMASDKQIIVYGSSKQGKTSLVESHIPYDKNIVIRLSPDSTRIDIYSSILRKAGVSIKESHSLTTGGEISIGAEAKFTAKVPIFTSGELDTNISGTGSIEKEQAFKEIPFNLSLANDVAELLNTFHSSKYIILENFHYLDDERQKELAVDLRNFQEMGVRFVILGVWREKNRLAQFNGDLLDRSKEIPVEPWGHDEFLDVIRQGEKQLNIVIADYLRQKAIETSFSSIGVFQEIIKQLCLESGVTQREEYSQNIENENYLDKARSRKADEYSSRHQRALEAIAAGNVETRSKDGVIPLYLSYYLVRSILELGFDGLSGGLSRSTLHEKIKTTHHRKADVRVSDMTNLLMGLGTLQAKKSISPPIIDFDNSTKKIQIVDSTFYFFLKNADLNKILNELPNPLEG